MQSSVSELKRNIQQFIPNYIDETQVSHKTLHQFREECRSCYGLLVDLSRALDDVHMTHVVACNNVAVTALKREYKEVDKAAKIARNALTKVKNQFKQFSHLVSAIDDVLDQISKESISKLAREDIQYYAKLYPVEEQMVP